MRIVFMGTPDFAVASLEAIVNAGHEVAAVITAPDKPAGRGLALKASPVKVFAQSKGIDILQPTNLKSQDFIDTLRSYEAELGVVVAFRMLPEVVWNMFPKGTFNLHASLLPQYRGAAPINHAIINGEKETGVTTFFLQQEIDKGSIIAQKTTPIEENETAGALHDRLMILGAELALETIALISSDKFTASDQVESVSLKTAPKIFKDFCEIDFDKNALQVHNHIRGLSPFPGAYTYIKLNGKNSLLKILKTRVSEQDSEQTPAKFESDGKVYLRIFCKKGSILLHELQPEGKKKMDIKSFLNGHQHLSDIKIGK
jgi:methionyl-tRNA formyltransferase